MSFVSESQRRWWFANNGGGSGGGSGGLSQFSQRELPETSSADMKAALRQRAQRDAAEAAAAQSAYEDALANYRRAEDEHFDRQAAYWRGEG
ncbi:hypothetical protein [Melaminivora suipulveris]|uniref:hypothetical protein n=1 Tax=Melaminivora suipulveris TaxID=2109913 RepID=UPI00131A565E|nr:hypothetical protein [Melaminivora suipulveris]